MLSVTCRKETELEDVVRGIYYVTLRYRNNLQQQIELMILPPGINLLNYGWMPGVEGSVRLNYSRTNQPWRSTGCSFLGEQEEEVDEGRERTLRSDIKPREQMMSRHGGANRILR